MHQAGCSRHPFPCSCPAPRYDDDDDDDKIPVDAPPPPLHSPPESMTSNDAVKALHRLGRREFHHGNWDAGVKCFSSVSHPSIRATLEECLDAQVELAKLLLQHRRSVRSRGVDLLFLGRGEKTDCVLLATLQIESDCPKIIQRVCDILNTAELQIPSLLDPLNAPLTDDLVDRVILEGKLYYYQHQAWKEMDNEKLV